MLQSLPLNRSVSSRCYDTDRSYDSKKNARWNRRKLYMKVLRSLLPGFFVLLILAGNCQFSPNVSAADLFSKVQCGTDIPKALIGGFMTNERDAVIEARHKALGLKNLGGSEETGDLFLSSWLICGNEYMLILDKKSIVRDVLQFHENSKASP